MDTGCTLAFLAIGAALVFVGGRQRDKTLAEEITARAGDRLDTPAGVHSGRSEAAATAPRQR